VRVQDVVIWHESLGLSAEEIIARCPALNVEDIEAALDYYRDHREDIRGDIADDEVRARAASESTPSKLPSGARGNR